MFGTRLIPKHWEIIMIYSWSQTCFYLLMYLKISERLVWTFINSMRLTIFTSICLSWDAMLKMTIIKLKLKTGTDLFQFIEKGMRGGIIATGMEKQMVNTRKNMMRRGPQSILYILILIIWVVRLWVSIFLLVNSNGWKKKKLKRSTKQNT